MDAFGCLMQQHLLCLLIFPTGSHQWVINKVGNITQITQFTTNLENKWEWIISRRAQVFHCAQTVSASQLN